MRVLVLGGTGMLGHAAWRVMSRRFDAFVTLRGSWAACPHRHLFDPRRTAEFVTADGGDGVDRALRLASPQVVVNCVGVVKQHRAALDPATSVAVNSLFPHTLAARAAVGGFRLIHLSTDCVFSGRRGNYAETDAPDPEDLYGRSKLLGEVDRPGCLTIRTSMIGWELGSALGLAEWLVRQRGRTVPGYTRAVFSGFTTGALSELLADVIERHPGLEGVRHAAAEPITKYDLLCKLRDRGGLGVRVEPDDRVACDRSLNAARFRAETGLHPPPWGAMVEGLWREATAPAA